MRRGCQQKREFHHGTINPGGTPGQAREHARMRVLENCREIVARGAAEGEKPRLIFNREWTRAATEGSITGKRWKRGKTWKTWKTWETWKTWKTWETWKTGKIPKSSESRVLPCLAFFIASSADDVNPLNEQVPPRSGWSEPQSHAVPEQRIRSHCKRARPLPYSAAPPHFDADRVRSFHLCDA